MRGSVLITGAAGFLGSHLCERYLKNEYFVAGVDNFATGQKKNVEYLRGLPEVGNKFYFAEADVCTPWRDWTSSFPDFVIKQLKFILHFASPASPPHYQRLAKETMWVNSLGTQQTLELADRNAARVIFASTSEIYGDPELTPQPETYWGHVNTIGPRACYDEAKRFGEALIHTHNLKNQTRHGFVRIFNTYGPRMNHEDGRVIINFLIQAMRGEPLTIYGTGKQTRSFCYVSDLIEAIVRYAETDLTVPVNIGNGTEFTILELVEVVQKIFPSQKLARAFCDLPKDDPRQRRPLLTLSKQSLGGWEPVVNLEEGLTRMVEALKTELA